MKDKNKQRVYWHNRSYVCLSAPTVNIKSTFTHLRGGIIQCMRPANERWRYNVAGRIHKMIPGYG